MDVDGEGPAGSVSMVMPGGPVRDLVMKSLLTLRDVQITTGHDPAVAYIRSDAFGGDYLESLVSIAAMRVAFDSPRRHGERSRSCDTDRDRGHRRRAEARAAERNADRGRGGDLRREAERHRDDTERRRDDTERRRDDTERRGRDRRDDTERRGRSADRGRSGKMHDKDRGRTRSHDSDRAGPDKKRRM